MDSRGLYSFAEHAEKGKAHHRLGLLHEAAAEYRNALQIRPGDADILHLLGVACFQTGRADEGIAAVREALSINRTDEYFSTLARIFTGTGRLAEGVAAARRSLAINPTAAPISTHMGMTLTAAQEPAAAVKALRRAIRLGEESPVAVFMLASNLQVTGAGARAIEAFRIAACLDPAYAEALTAVGVGFIERCELDAAVAACRHAARANPMLTEAHLTLAHAFYTQKRFDLAAEACKHAAVVNPASSVALGNLATILDELGVGGTPITLWRRALDLNPEMPQALYQFVTHAKKVCMWTGLAEREQRMLDIVRRNQPGVSPWSMFMQPSTPADQLLCARLWGEGQRGGIAPFPPRAPRRGERIRIGYLSSDFRPHAVSFLLQDIIERHDRSRFEVFGYSLSPDDGSAFRTRLAGLFDRFVEASALTDLQIAERIRQDEVDILVDLNGYTQGARTRILAMRPAPIQVNYLGFAGTMGVPYIDYMLTDRFLTPPGAEASYAEKLAFLPSYQPNSTRAITPSQFARSAFGLPENGFVFASFNNTYKINAPVFEIWMRLLRAVPGSALWLKQANDEVVHNLRREAEARGVDPDRLVFAGGLARHEDHLARHACADLFLDCLPYNAHTTASDALWAGLPVVTCAGDSFASRVAGSALTALGVPELITHSLADYEALALKLATDPVALAAVREKIRDRVRTSPLFDIALYTRTMDAAYGAMWERWQSGLPPEHITIDGSGSHVMPDAPAAPAPLRRATGSKVGLIQTRGIGDIVIAAPIAQHYVDAGAEVFWPVDSRFHPFVQSAFPEISFLSVDIEESDPALFRYFVGHPVELLTHAGCDPIYCLYSYMKSLPVAQPNLAEALKFDEYKYAISNVPFSKKWQLRITRDRAREAALIDRLGLDRPYVVVHEEGSNFQLNITLPPDMMEQYAVVRITNLTPNPFDWLGVLEGASVFVGIDSCFANLIEQLDLCPQKFLYLRSTIVGTPVFKNNWKFRWPQ
ncbi:glycosyltransferase family 41 protein [Azospirillum sp. TSO22-1]|uniref:O-linked N-acetylglucosamine transferase, SPINDLY family protein n=1 Tax=Azospirillum sp. TSO22-1 TaxID=716789 RepID=UPI000D64BD38|nr:glycosyltransferase family 41 protein [Azospirillum sp. TSO22-1]